MALRSRHRSQAVLILLRRLIVTVPDTDTKLGSRLGRYLQVLTKEIADERRNRLASNEARRVSRRCVYKADDADVGKPPNQVSFKEIAEVEGRLKEDLDQLERSGAQVDFNTCVSLLRQCASTRALAEGRRLHFLVSRSGQDSNIFLANLLIQMYGNCGCLEDALTVFNRLKPPNVFSWNIMITAYARNGHLQEARELFDRMPTKSVASWNTMIAAYAQSGHSQEALSLFQAMDQEPSKITFINVLEACDSLEALKKAKMIHASIIKHGLESDVMVATALFNVYAKHGSLQDARSIFDKVPQRDVVSWNAMAAAYAQKGHLEDAMSLFNEMPNRNAVSWNTMIAAYAQGGYCKEAFELFQLMDLEGVEANKITFISVLHACTGTNSLAEGKLIHSYMIENGFELDLAAGTALVSMYGKCGTPRNAKKIFLEMTYRNAVTWAALVAAYARNGHGEVALRIFRIMCQEGVTPNEITFVNVLHACSHGGLLEDGWGFFQSMIADYGIEPIVEHFVCMIDLLGRSGVVDAAEQLIDDMPFEPDVVAWMVLLGACRMHNNVEIGANAAKQIMKLDPGNSASYTLLRSRITLLDRYVLVSCITKIHRFFATGNPSFRIKRNSYFEEKNTSPT